MRRESVAGVFGIAVGLLLLAAGATALFSQKPSQVEVDPEEAWAKSFVLPDAWPDGLAPTAAAELVGGDAWIHLGGFEESQPPSEDSEAPEETESGGDSQGGDWDSVDWVAVEATGSGEAPSEAFLITRARRNAEGLRDKYFRNLPRRGVDDLESKGGRVIIETGEVLWQGYDANTVHERRYFKRDGEPTFRDSIRVNVSVSAPCVLIALWPERSAAQIEALQPLLDVLIPLE